MLIKVNNEFLEFNELVEMEKQIKLFEEISTTDGDFSYAFELQKTITNSRILGNPYPDNVSKPVYQKIAAKLLSDTGAETFDGYIRIEKITEVYQCSFFAGNNNWFGMLSDSLRAIDWSDYDLEQNQSVIQNSTLNSSGVVFPLIDNGALTTRSYPTLKVEDFTAAIYVKDVFARVFSTHNIKIQGELLNDVNYLSALTITNPKSEEELTANSIFVENSITTSRPAENVKYKMFFQNKSVYPYYDHGDNFDLVTSTYTARYKERILIEASFQPEIVDASYNQRIYLYINGAFTFVDIGLDVGGLYNAPTAGNQEFFTLKRTIDLNAGDTLEVYTEWQQSTGSTQNDVLNGTLKITPEYIYNVFGNNIVPDWTQQQYVSNILKVFNVLSSYNSKNKTLTFNLLEKIKDKDPIDLSEFVSETEIDYTEFVSNYGRKSYLSHKELDEDLVNLKRFPYSKGVIEVNNDFIEEEADIVETDFTAPIGYVNPVFKMSMERTNFVRIELSDSYDFIGVVDDGGLAAFTTVGENNIFTGDLVRISESQNPNYNGDWRVNTKSAPYIIGAETRVDLTIDNLPFDTAATGKIAKIVFKYNDSSDVYLLHNIPTYNITQFSDLPEIKLENTFIETWSPAFYNILFTNKPINYLFKFSMAFETHAQQEQYQVSLIDQYYRLTGRVLNDPVKLFNEAHLSHALFNQIDFLSPVMIKTIETTNLYYLNRITGYNESYLPCVLELIKLP